MKNLKNIQIAILGAVMLLPMGLAAQQASISIQGLSGTNIAITGGAVYLPNGSYLNSTGNIYLATNKIVADSANTVFTGGAGNRIHLLGGNQLDATITAAPTLIDVNGANFNVAVTSYNPQNLSLTDQTFGTVVTNNNANITFNNEFAFATTNPFTGAAIANSNVVTNANKLSVGNAGTLIGYSTSKYVVTNDNAGELRKLGLTTGNSFFFPIGRAQNDYTPARLQVATGGPVNYYMNVRNFAESAPNENIGFYSSMPNVSRTWMVYANDSTTTANMDFIHPGTPMYEVNGYDRNNSNVIRFSGNAWEPNSPSDVENEALFGTDANYFAQQNTFKVPSIIGANTFYGKSNALVILPIKLESFATTVNNCEATINWSTSIEQNISHFDVERNVLNNNTAWVTIYTNKVVGNSTSLKNYSYVDAKANAAAAQYRLAIVDKDGNKTYSPISFVRFNCGNNNDIKIYPNPAHSYVQVLLPQANTSYQIKVINTAGQTVLPVLNNVVNLTTLQTTVLANGSYIIQVTDKNGKQTNLPLIKN